MMCNALNIIITHVFFTPFIETRAEIVGEWTNPENIVHCSENNVITEPEMRRCLLFEFIFIDLSILKNEIWSLVL